MKSPPQYQAPPPDPLYTQLQQQAQQDQVTQTQTQLRADSASLMARYGALVGVSGGAAPSTATPSTLPIGMALNLMNGNSGILQVATAARMAA